MSEGNIRISNVNIKNSSKTGYVFYELIVIILVV